MSTLLLGLDPGFADFGFALLDVSGSETKFLRMGVLRTKPDPRREVYACDDNVRRARSIHRGLVEIFDAGELVAICAESQSWPRNAGAATKVAMAWGVIASRAEARSIPIIQVSPQAVRRALGLGHGAGKRDIQEAVREHLDGDCRALFEGQLARIPKGAHEHPVDALAAAIACLDSEPVRELLAGRRAA
jgi:crossover junction endodeoxyribonuclease RuvC